MRRQMSELTPIVFVAEESFDAPLCGSRSLASSGVGSKRHNFLGRREFRSPIGGYLCSVARIRASVGVFAFFRCRAAGTRPRVIG